MRRDSSKSTTRAFTLVEILIVLAIVALLAAILFSAFDRVRSSARTASCASNLRQIGMALQLYTADNRGFYPSLQTRTNIKCSWPESIYPLVKNTGVFWCPSAPNGEYRLGCPPEDDSWGDSITQRRNWHGSYEMVQLYTGSPTARFNEIRLRHPSSTVVFFDGQGGLSSYDLRTRNAGLPPGFPLTTEDQLLDFQLSIPDRHNGGVNACYADGHVKWLSFDAMRDPSLWRPD